MQQNIHKLKGTLLTLVGPIHPLTLSKYILFFVVITISKKKWNKALDAPAPNHPWKDVGVAKCKTQNAKWSPGGFIKSMVGFKESTFIQKGIFKNNNLNLINSASPTPKFPRKIWVFLADPLTHKMIHVEFLFDFKANFTWIGCVSFLFLYKRT